MPSPGGKTPNTLNGDGLDGQAGPSVEAVYIRHYSRDLQEGEIPYPPWHQIKAHLQPVRPSWLTEKRYRLSKEADLLDLEISPAQIDSGLQYWSSEVEKTLDHTLKFGSFSRCLNDNTTAEEKSQLLTNYLEEGNAQGAIILLLCGAHPAGSWMPKHFKSSKTGPDSKAYHAVKAKNPILVATLWYYGDYLENRCRCSINWIASTSHSSKSCRSPLHIAIRNNDIEMLKLLLQLGVAPNGHQKHSVAPLLVAIEFAQLEMVKLLLLFDADPLGALPAISGFPDSISRYGSLHDMLVVDPSCTSRPECVRFILQFVQARHKRQRLLADSASPWQVGPGYDH